MRDADERDTAGNPLPDELRDAIYSNVKLLLSTTF